MEIHLFPPIIALALPPHQVYFDGSVSIVAHIPLGSDIPGSALQFILQNNSL